MRPPYPCKGSFSFIFFVPNPQCLSPPSWKVSPATKALSRTRAKKKKKIRRNGPFVDTVRRNLNTNKEKQTNLVDVDNASENSTAVNSYKTRAPLLSLSILFCFFGCVRGTELPSENKKCGLHAHVISRRRSRRQLWLPGYLARTTRIVSGIPFLF